MGLSLSTLKSSNRMLGLTLIMLQAVLNCNAFCSSLARTHFPRNLANTKISASTGSPSERHEITRNPVMIFGRRGAPRKHSDEVTVNIETPGMNSRRISGTIIVDAPVNDVWKILTDYDNLATHVPNLVQSRRVVHPNDGIRLFQEGAQKIIGFDFRASLTMDMKEVYESEDAKFYQRKILFKLVESAMFNGFDGEWRVQNYSRMKNPDALSADDAWIYTTKVFYVVEVKPRGPVPVAALEWQIKSEVPNNLRAVKAAAEKIRKLDFASVVSTPSLAKSSSRSSSQKSNDPDMQRTGWEEDETLDMYSFVEKER